LKGRDNTFFLNAGIRLPLPQRHTPGQWNPQLQHCENLKNSQISRYWVWC